MIIENQKIQMKWNNNNKKWYEQHGYNFTKVGDDFFVSPEDLSTASSRCVRVKCDYCGEEYTANYGALIKGRAHLNKDACCHCASKKANEIHRKEKASKMFEKARTIANDNNYTLLSNEDDYTGVFMRIKYICKKHGVQECSLDNFIRGHGCYFCGRENVGVKSRTDIDEVERIINSANENVLLNKEDYKDAITPNLKIRCSCGNIFIASLHNYTKKESPTNRCRICSKNISQGENIISKFLECHNIKYIPEKRFEDCRDKKTLPFDFYLPDYNCCIEFDGEQHIRQVFTEESFKNTVKHDKMKDDYCKNNNMKLIRIPYKNMNNIEDILKTELCIT